MRINRVTTPQSAFLSVEKDSAIIMSEMLKNLRLKKYLVYNPKDSKGNNLNPLTWDGFENPKTGEREDWGDKAEDLFRKSVRFRPKIKIEPDDTNIIIVKFNRFTPNMHNTEFRDNLIEFDIVCHFDNWDLENFAQRPFKIAAEIDSMFNKKHLTGIGTLQFIAGNPFVLNNEFGGFALQYKAIHGEEDKTPMPTAEEQELLESTYYPGLEF